MSTAEILAELPKLSVEARAQVFIRLCELREDDLVRAGGPSDEERRRLDEALAESEREGDFGVPWREVLQEIRASGPR